jgi:hypothetical protein
MSKPADNLTVARGIGLDQAVKAFEQWFCWWALERNDFNQSTTAEELKIHRNSLVNRLREWDWMEKVHANYEERHSRKRGKLCEKLGKVGLEERTVTIRACPTGFTL